MPGAGERKSSGPYADFPILACGLIAVTGRFSEAVKVAFVGLPLSIDRDQGVLEALEAKTVRIAFRLRPSISPRFPASYALVHHKPFRSRLLLTIHPHLTIKSDFERSDLKIRLRFENMQVMNQESLHQCQLHLFTGFLKSVRFRVANRKEQRCAK